MQSVQHVSRVFSLSKNQHVYDLCWKNIYPFSSHSSMLREGKGVEHLQYKSFGHHLGAENFHWAHDYSEKIYMKHPQILLLPPQKKGSPVSSPDWKKHINPPWLTQLPCPRKPLAKQGCNQQIPWFLHTIFATEKMGFADFCYRWWQLKYVQFVSPIPEEIIQFHKRAYFFRWHGGSTHQPVLGEKLPLIFPKKSPNLP